MPVVVDESPIAVTFVVFTVGEPIDELLDDPEVDRNALPMASLDGEKRRGSLGFGSCQSANVFLSKKGRRLDGLSYLFLWFWLEYLRGRPTRSHLRMPRCYFVE